MCLGLPGQIVEIVDARRKLAKVDVAGVKRTVNIACIVDEARPVEACVGEWVLVHVGFAMSRIDAAEAEKTIALLTELEEAESKLRSLDEAMR
jgi:hydrogenase expression/formation protein HypC